MYITQVIVYITDNIVYHPGYSMYNRHIVYHPGYSIYNRHIVYHPGYIIYKYTTTIKSQCYLHILFIIIVNINILIQVFVECYPSGLHVYRYALRYVIVLVYYFHLIARTSKFLISQGRAQVVFAQGYFTSLKDVSS